MRNPFPEQQIRAIIDRYENADSVFWVQEEPEYMGPWPFTGGRLHNLLPDRVKIGHASRCRVRLTGIGFRPGPRPGARRPPRRGLLRRLSTTSSH